MFDEGKNSTSWNVNKQTSKFKTSNYKWNVERFCRCRNFEEKNIIYCGTETKIHSTAELAWALIMNSWRGLQTEIENMKDGNWQTTIGRGLKGNTLGIFGLGKQGLQVANYAKAFGMKVIAWSHNLKQEDCEKVGVEYVSNTDLFKMSDILTIHTRLSDRTRGYINKDNLRLMKKICYCEY